MREALAFLSLIALVVLGWNQSYQDHFAHMTGGSIAPKKRTTPKPVVRVAPQPGQVPQSISPTTRDRSWMWQKTNMDQPYDNTRGRGR
jgi:hypothetical protein